MAWQELNSSPIKQLIFLRTTNLFGALLQQMAG
jgi:hypothetical protein